MVPPNVGRNDWNIGAQILSAHLDDLSNFDFKVSYASDIDDLVENLCSGEADISYLSHIECLMESIIEAVEDLVGRKFCRSDPASVSGWAVPRLMLIAHGIAPEADLRKIVHAGSHAEVVNGIYLGNWEAGAAWVDAREIGDAGPDIFEEVIVVEVSPSIPNHAIAFSPMISPEKREQIVSALKELARSDNGQALLSGLFQAEGLEVVDDTLYDGIRALLEEVGLSVEEAYP